MTIVGTSVMWEAYMSHGVTNEAKLNLPRNNLI